MESSLAAGFRGLMRAHAGCLCARRGRRKPALASARSSLDAPTRRPERANDGQIHGSQAVLGDAFKDGQDPPVRTWPFDPVERIIEDNKEPVSGGLSTR